jgi:phospholipase/carboxylesterase
MANKLDFIEINPDLPAKRSVIWLHGLGADGNDFMPIVPELKIAPEKAVRFIFPHAPMRSVTINNGYVMRAWYDIYSLQNLMQEDEIGIRDSIKIVNELIEQEYAKGIAYENILLAGFSQGGAVALAAGLRYPQKLAGILALSAYLPLAQSVVQERSLANATIPIFMAHGSEDMVLPPMLGQISREFLISQDYSVEWKTYPMEHSVCLEEIKDISAWLKGIF